MNSKKITIIIIIVLLVIICAYFFSQWCFAAQQAKALNNQIRSGQINEKVLSFSKLLTETVLSGSKEISFDDRLRLENAVRELNDKEILNQWKRFTQSSPGTDSQQSFTDLLKILLKKISY